MKRALTKHYVCVYLDASYIAVKRETVSKEAIYLAVGICEDGSKEVLTCAITPTVSAYVREELLQDVQESGTEEVLLFNLRWTGRHFRRYWRSLSEGKVPNVLYSFSTKHCPIKSVYLIVPRFMKTLNRCTEQMMSKLVKKL
ncbi:hypothetical protein GCM10010913_32510 [Paenibacillus aceti]|uniref:Mutator family transposase n=1 Tax=Paenibacillus aceti TaxID=1820010 RepID=A0ABQ1W0I7_9BACL|nr:hypothetical protein GCM10010913_32510 [Paenibacillus aceti]